MASMPPAAKDAAPASAPDAERGSASPAAAGAGASHAAEEDVWWKPQPKASLDDEHVEFRPAPPMAEALSCTICRDLLKETITAVDCGHSYCYDCIDDRISIGGKSNMCPVCSAYLGPNPFEHNKLKYDFMLDTLVRKVFPRPLLDSALDARRTEREQTTREMKAVINRKGGVAAAAAVAGGGAAAAAAAAVAPAAGAAGASSGAAGHSGGGTSRGSTGDRPAGADAAGSAPSVRTVALAIFPAPSGATSQLLGTAPPPANVAALPALERPYLRVPGTMPVRTVLHWLTGQLAQLQVPSEGLELRCKGRLLDASSSLQDIHDTIWAPHAQRDPIMRLDYTCPAASAPAPQRAPPPNAAPGQGDGAPSGDTALGGGSGGGGAPPGAGEGAGAADGAPAGHGGPAEGGGLAGCSVLDGCCAWQARVGRVASIGAKGVDQTDAVVSATAARLVQHLARLQSGNAAALATTEAAPSWTGDGGVGGMPTDALLPMHRPAAPLAPAALPAASTCAEPGALPRPPQRGELRPLSANTLPGGGGAVGGSLRSRQRKRTPRAGYTAEEAWLRQQDAPQEQQQQQQQTGQQRKEKPRARAQRRAAAAAAVAPRRTSEARAPRSSRDGVLAAVIAAAGYDCGGGGSPLVAGGSAFASTPLSGHQGGGGGRGTCIASGSAHPTPAASAAASDVQLPPPAGGAANAGGEQSSNPTSCDSVAPDPPCPHAASGVTAAAAPVAPASTGLGHLLPEHPLDDATRAVLAAAMAAAQAPGADAASVAAAAVAAATGGGGGSGAAAGTSASSGGPAAQLGRSRGRASVGGVAAAECRRVREVAEEAGGPAAPCAAPPGAADRTQRARRRASGAPACDAPCGGGGGGSPGAVQPAGGCARSDAVGAKRPASSGAASCSFGGRPPKRLAAVAAVAAVRAVSYDSPLDPARGAPLPGGAQAAPEPPPPKQQQPRGRPRAASSRAVSADCGGEAAGRGASAACAPGSGSTPQAVGPLIARRGPGSLPYRVKWKGAAVAPGSVLENREVELSRRVLEFIGTDVRRERETREYFGNNPDTSKVMRNLTALGRLSREGCGGKRDPYRYKVTPAGFEWAERMAEEAEAAAAGILAPKPSHRIMCHWQYNAAKARSCGHNVSGTPSSATPGRRSAGNAPPGGTAGGGRMPKTGWGVHAAAARAARAAAASGGGANGSSGAEGGLSDAPLRGAAAAASARRRARAPPALRLPSEEEGGQLSDASADSSDVVTSPHMEGLAQLAAAAAAPWLGSPEARAGDGCAATAAAAAARGTPQPGRGQDGGGGGGGGGSPCHATRAGSQPPLLGGCHAQDRSATPPALASGAACEGAPDSLQRGGDLAAGGAAAGGDAPPPPTPWAVLASGRDDAAETPDAGGGAAPAAGRCGLAPCDEDPLARDTGGKRRRCGDQDARRARRPRAPLAGRAEGQLPAGSCPAALHALGATADADENGQPIVKRKAVTSASPPAAAAAAAAHGDVAGLLPCAAASLPFMPPPTSPAAAPGGVPLRWPLIGAGAAPACRG